jgi:predicted Zn finger-like uncharacterized protein
MKITCQACAAKYTIADEKVLGKVVKIRCKKCGATIVVNGNDPAAIGSGAAGPASQAAPAYDYAQQGAGAEPWTVNVADGDQRTMTDQEVVDAYHAGVVTDETFCWKDGMTDWLPLREIEFLYAACTSTRAMPPPQEMPGAARRSDAPTRIQDTGGLMFGGAPAPAPTPYAPQPQYAPQMAAPPMADAGNGGAMFTDASPVAARRAGGRAATADLFSGAAQAGGEDDVMTSAPAGIPQPHEDEQKLTGARNENSVLFSLSALTSKGPGGGAGAGGPMPATGEASGLIDIKQLGAQIGLGPEKKRSAVDDIMNLAGGGAFSPSLSAPVLSAPPIEEYAPSPDIAAALPGPAPRNKLILFVAIVAGLGVIALAVGAASSLMRGKDETADKAAASASAAETLPSASAAATDTPAASASVAAAATGTASPSAQSSKPTSDTGRGSKHQTTAPTDTSTPPAPVAAAAPPPTQQVLPDVPAAPPPAPVATPTNDQPFNMGAAKASLGAIAGAVQGCKRGDATGSGRVVVTFAPSGQVQSAVVTDPPFAGTPTGSCVASRFRSAHVPAFTGSPFEVAKHFTIN